MSSSYDDMLEAFVRRTEEGGKPNTIVVSAAAEARIAAGLGMTVEEFRAFVRANGGVVALTWETEDEHV